MTLTLLLGALLALALLGGAVALTLLVTARREIARARGGEAEARAGREAAERELMLARHQIEAAQERMRDFERTKADAIQAAQAAALVSSREVSGKLLEDHKREAEAQRKDGEQRVAQAAAALTQRFEDVSKLVATLQDRVGRNQDTVEIVQRALSHPAGAGHYAEIGLENMLKSFGLERDRDFVLQYNVAGDSGARLRPDAVVFLPGDSVLVIDSKASKFLLELAAATAPETRAAAEAKFAASMAQSLKDLAARDYRSAIEQAFRQHTQRGEIRRILSLMYLPTEGALETLSRIDPDFAARAARAEIIPAGPTGLAGLIAFARVEIDMGRQQANREHIVEACQRLLEALPVVLGHADGMGKGLKRAVDSFEKLVGSINRTLLPRARKITALGVRPAKPLPDNLALFQVVALDGSVIEGEAAEIAPRELAPPEEDVQR